MVTFDPEAQAPAGSSRSYGRDWSSSERAVGPDAADSEARLHGRLVVPPDRALLEMRAVVIAQERATIISRVNEVAELIREGIDAGEGCEARVTQLTTSQPDGDRWRAAALLATSVDLRGLSDVAARHARLESCIGRMHETIADLEGVQARVGAPLLSVDSPRDHRAALLRQALGAIRDVRRIAEEDQLGPELDPNLTRCRSEGRVRIVNRSLDGIALGVDLECQRASVHRSTERVEIDSETEAM